MKLDGEISGNEKVRERIGCREVERVGEMCFLKKVEGRKASGLDVILMN